MTKTEDDLLIEDILEESEYHKVLKKMRKYQEQIEKIMKKVPHIK